MRVAIDARLPSYTTGGISVYVRHLIAALRTSAPDLDVRVLVARQNGTRALAAGFRAVPVRTPAHHRFERTALALEALPLRPDIFHSPDFVPPRTLGWRAVITVHDLAFLLYPELLTPASRRYYGQVVHVARAVARVIAVSRATAERTVRLLGVPPERVQVVYHGVAPQFAPQPDLVQRTAAEQLLGAADPFALFVGTLEPRKNLLRLLDAWEAARSRGWLPERAHLVLVGRPGWLCGAILSRLDHMPAEQQVHLHAALRYEQLPAAYAAATAVVLPSLDEGFGLPLLEALACGTPVLAAAAGALPELAGPGCLLVDPLDVEALAAGLRRIFADADLAQTAATAGREHAARFRWERTAEETLAIYHAAHREAG
ncbi:MAG: glycosyltransferase family 4 protein [Chloroflexi bacterium]|nr:glycosyltransferase family 4 protein [Chloroflexota bacterium]